MSAFYFSFTCFYDLYCFFGRLIFYESMLAAGENWRFQMRKWCIMHLYVHSVDESEPWMKVLQTFQKPRPIFFFFPSLTTKLQDSITRREPWLLPAKSMRARLSVDLPMGTNSNKLLHQSGSTSQCHPKLALALRNLAKVSWISWMSGERQEA